jgi:hypothetical protein
MKFASGLTIESALESAATLRETFEKLNVEADVPEGEIVILADEVLRLRTFLKDSPDVREQLSRRVEKISPEEWVSYPGSSDLCTCRHEFRGSGGGRQEVSVRHPRCLIHGKPSPLTLVKDE